MNQKKCIFVVGPESSGSTWIARVISTLLGRSEWNGRGFNCCSRGRCDADSRFLRPCSEVQDRQLVCHRSIPFGPGDDPPIEAWRQIYEASWVVCTRDPNISERSRQQRMGKSEEGCRRESEHASSMLAGLLLDPRESVFVWSYESFAFLGSPYLQELLTFLGCDAPPEIPEALRFQNANEKYLR